MPYLKKDFRREIDQYGNLQELLKYTTTLELKDFLGAVNYIIFSIVKVWLDYHGINYGNVSSIIGTVDCAKEELRRRILNPYEDTKISENGDVE